MARTKKNSAERKLNFVESEMNRANMEKQFSRSLLYSSVSLLTTINFSQQRISRSSEISPSDKLMIRLKSGSGCFQLTVKFVEKKNLRATNCDVNIPDDVIYNTVTFS